MLDKLAPYKIYILATLISLGSSAYVMIEDFPSGIETFDPAIYVTESTNKSYNISFGGPTFSTQSVLSEGGIYRIAITTDGVHELTHQMLSEVMDLSTIDPTEIKIYGHPAGALPEDISDDMIDDLIELSLSVEGETDGSFDPEDRIVFYAQGPDRTSYHSESKRIEIDKNVYSRNSYYFIKTTGGKGLRIPKLTNVEEVDVYSSSIDALIYIGESQINLLGSYTSTQGSGQQWFDRNLSNQRLFNLSSELDLSAADLADPVQVELLFAGRSQTTTEVKLSIQDEEFKSSIGRVRTGDVEATYARTTKINETLNLSSTDPQVIIEYPGDRSTSEGWLDYISVQYKKKLQLSETQVITDFNSADHETYGYSMIVSDTQTPIVWDITNPMRPVNQLFQRNGGDMSFGYDAELLRQFVAFDSAQNLLRPSTPVKIENQNVHGIDDVDLVIIYHRAFQQSAEKLAAHRRHNDDLSVVTVDVQSIYNEFSAAKQDPTAIRNFAKMLYDRTDKFKFLLLIGDGSYDFIGVSPELDNQSFIPPYETKESLNPLTAFPTDDYYALLSDNEGANLKGAIDIAVGRIPVKTTTEANQVIDKIISYDTNPERFGDWRLRIAFSADDEDSNIHVRQADGIATKTEEKHTVFNQEKIYFDAFIQESTPGGARYPDANSKLNNEIFNGLLVSNYMGHGGPRGWSQERVLKVSDIRSWDNADKLPLIITATCSFTGFDDPALVTAGEEAILNPNGGAVALFSTVRSVYSSQNERLTRSVYDTLFAKDDDEFLAIGEVLRRAKNANSADTINVNARKFLLIGDPSMKLSLPQHNINALSINRQDIKTSNPDTINALEEVVIEGEITDSNGDRMTGFNGIVTTTLYDKANKVSTLQNDRSSFQKEFSVRKNKLFRGTATVSNGYFTSSFVIPVDIDYTYGPGKLSFYATDNQSADAAGYYDQLIIGGTSDEIILDDKPPVIEAYLNTLSFKSGDSVSPSSILLLKLSDDKGINFTGTSIGHDITAILDGNTQNTIILNDFYLSDLDNASGGSVSFPLQELSPGEHKLEIQAFDVANNPARTEISFMVIDAAESMIENLAAAPNPTSERTTFSFSHARFGQNVSLRLSIYDMSGRKMVTLDRRSDGGIPENQEISWDGRDSGGNIVNPGIYIYQVKILSPTLNISMESSFEKIVVIK